MKINKEKILEWFWFVFGVGMLIASVILIRNGELESMIAGFGIWAPIAIVFLKASTLVLAPLGGSPLYLISGALFGKWIGLILVLLGDFIGVSICFLISRRYGRKVMKFFTGKGSMDQIEKALSLLEETKSFLKARIAFTGGPEFLAYAAGLSQIKYKKFIALHMPFHVPVDFVFVFLGAQLAVVSAKYAFLPIAVVFLVSMAGFWFLLQDYEKLSAA